MSTHDHHSSFLSLISVKCRLFWIVEVYGPPLLLWELFSCLAIRCWSLFAVTLADFCGLRTRKLLDGECIVVQRLRRFLEVFCLSVPWMSVRNGGSRDSGWKQQIIMLKQPCLILWVDGCRGVWAVRGYLGVYYQGGWAVSHCLLFRYFTIFRLSLPSKYR